MDLKNFKNFFRGLITVFAVFFLISMALVYFMKPGLASNGTKKVDPLTDWTADECQKKVESINPDVKWKEYWEPSESKCFAPPAKVVTATGLFTSGSGISGYISSLYAYAVGIAGIFAVVMMMVGGLIWMTAGGSPDKVTKAKSFIFSALTGLVLLLCSYMILYIVNPRLVMEQSISVPMITGETSAAFGCAWSPDACPKNKFQAEEDKCGAGSGVCCCYACFGDGEKCFGNDQECCQDGDMDSEGKPYTGTDLICNEDIFNKCMPPQPAGKGCQEGPDCESGACKVGAATWDRCAKNFCEMCGFGTFDNCEENECKQYSIEQQKHPTGGSCVFKERIWPIPNECNYK